METADESGLTQAVGEHSLTLSLPERYDGHPDKCRSFLLQCNLYFAHRSGPELPGRAKVAAVITVLTGRVLEWATAVWERAGTELVSIDLFQSVFDHPATGKESVERLSVLFPPSYKNAAPPSLSYNALNFN